MVLGVLALAAVLAGCGSNWQNYSEKFIRSGVCQPGGKTIPPWVQGQLPRSDEEIYFVGRGVGYNVFDERGAYDGAVNHAVEQLAKQVATWVSIQGGEADVRMFAPGSGWLLVPGPRVGNRFLPGEQSKQKVRSAARMCTEALVGEMEPRDVYWEQWYIDEIPERPLPASLRMKRYKCWVLMAIPRKAMTARVLATLEALKTAGAGPQTFFAAVDSHGAVKAAGLDAAGASQLYRMTSPKAAQHLRTRQSPPPSWDAAVDITESKE